MNFDAIKDRLTEYITNEVPLGYTRSLFEAIEDLDIERLNAEILQAHNEEVAYWKHCLATKPHTPIWSEHVYAWVKEANEFLTTEPPVFVIPESWGVDAAQLRSRWQAHKERAA